MTYVLRYYGAIKATGTHMACEYAMQRASDQPIEDAILTGAWTIYPITEPLNPTDNE